MSESMKIIDPLQHWLEDYLPNIAGKKLKTVNNYKMAWKLFFMYMNGRGVPAENITYEMLDYDCVLGYLRWIEEDRSCKISTRNNRFAAISSFSKYSQNMDFNNS